MISIFDEDDESPTCGRELPNSYDYHLHLNNYLPTYNMSENSETDEQTPMLDRRHQILPNAGSFSPNANNDSFDLSSDFNASIRALPETNTNPRPGFEPSTMSDKLGYPSGNMGTTHFGGSPSLFSGSSNRQLPTTSSPIKNPSNISNRDSNPGQLDNLCQLEETDDEDLDTPIVENKPLTVAKITQV